MYGQLARNVGLQSIKMNRIATAGIIIIGDEILNGKIHDTNSYYFAQKMFSLGVECKRILVVPDDELEIHNAVQLMQKYDFVVTSGGIGPTHDDITYDSLASAFKLPTELHQETAERMARLSQKNIQHEGDARKAQLRMATFPKGDNVDVIFLRDDLWVPVVGLNERFYVLPGVPQLFTKLLDSLIESFKGTRIISKSFIRYFVKTPLRESAMAPHLSKLQKEVGNDIKIGSYPHMGQGFNTISVLGREEDKSSLQYVVDYCVKNLEGEQVTDEQEKSYSEKVEDRVE